nr:AAA family ATPase [uncultured Halomonas sp.]
MKLRLENIKGIGLLEFSVPPAGVWVLTGRNGTGKSTLLAALLRIRSSYAFQRYYQTSPMAHRVDLYENASVTYEINNRSVTYRYGGQRWRATPRSNAIIFDDFPYPSIEYLEANSDRIEPFADEISHNRFRDAGQGLKDFICEVLDDDKWSELKYLNTRRGTGNQAYLIPYRAHARAPWHYYSEKSFSLGELCVLRLAQRLSKVRNGSLILIDEIEMALHPQAQIRLLEALNGVAQARRLTVVFSTHSASIIKSAKRSQLIHLSEAQGGEIQVTQKPYPAQILGEVAFDDELNVDFVFFVEDKQAKILLEQIVQRYLQVANLEIRYQPLFKIVPVGGFVQVLEFLNASSQIFPAHVRRHAVLDQDVQTESLAEARRSGNQQLLNLFNRAHGHLSYLPCTPECGLTTMIEGGQMQAQLRASFAGHAVNFGRLIQTQDYLLRTSANPREQAKRRTNYLVEQVEAATGIDTVQIRRKLYSAYTEHRYATAVEDLHQFLGPVFNAR